MGRARRTAEFYRAKVNALPAWAEDPGRDALAYRAEMIAHADDLAAGQAELRAEHQTAWQMMWEVVDHEYRRTLVGSADRPGTRRPDAR